MLCIIFTYLIKVIAGDQLPIGNITTVSVPVLSNYNEYIYTNKNYSGGYINASSKICWYLISYNSSDSKNFLGMNNGKGLK